MRRLPNGFSPRFGGTGVEMTVWRAAGQTRPGTILPWCEATPLCSRPTPVVTCDSVVAVSMFVVPAGLGRRLQVFVASSRSWWGSCSRGGLAST